MRPPLHTLRAASVLLLLLAAGCEHDPARLADGPRYVWVDHLATLIAPDSTELKIARDGYAFAMAPPERSNGRFSAVLFTDSTMRDTIGYIGSASVDTLNPAGVLVRPGVPKTPPLTIDYPEEMARARAARRAEREARESGIMTRAGYPACPSREALARLKRKGRSTGATSEAEPCLTLRAGLPAALADSAAAGQARVRVYAEAEAVEVWTYAEAISR